MIVKNSDTLVVKFIETDTPLAELVPNPFVADRSGQDRGIESRCGDVALFCRCSPGKTEPNDDSAAVVYLAPDAAVLVVADGLGGSPLGHKASAIAVETVVEHVSAADPSDDLRVSILDAIEAANREILDLGIGAATTISIVQIQAGESRAYNVGDSMTMLFGQRGRMKWKSMPHSPVGYAVESGMLNEADAMIHDDRHVISNYVGSQNMHIEIGPKQQLSRRDTIIVGSDGLFDNVRLDEIVQIGRSGKAVDRVETLRQLATERMQGKDQSLPGKPDDLTILLYTRS